MNVLNIGELSPDFKFYRCGSPNLKDFLIKNCMEYIYSYKSNKTNRTIWIFVESKRLEELLTEWTNNKPIGGEVVG